MPEGLTPEQTKYAEEFASLDRQAVDAIDRNPGDGSYVKLREVNTDMAQEHVDQHQGQYIETARQEAEAQGVRINLKQPKE